MVVLNRRAAGSACAYVGPGGVQEVIAGIVEGWRKDARLELGRSHQQNGRRCFFPPRFRSSPHWHSTGGRRGDDIVDASICHLISPRWSEPASVAGWSVVISGWPSCLTQQTGPDCRDESSNPWPNLSMRSRQSRPRILPQSFDNSRYGFLDTTGSAVSPHEFGSSGFQ
jgi:hypothetical protein